MGSGLAEVAAKAGHDVVVRSRSIDTARAMVDTIAKGLDKQVQREKISAADKDAILGRIRATASIADLADCDLVIESVVEDLAVKKALFAELDAAVKKDAILATNTSTLPVVEMAMATSRPDKVCGIHFFNPATAMPLVEVVRPITSSDATIDAANAFVAACGKTGVQVKDRAGFIVNALLFPYLNNAVRIWEAGTASMEDIDAAMKGGCNFPMGPFALLDLVGLDTSLAILDALHAEFADPNYAAVPTLRRLVTAGKLGRKSGAGFYTY
jgi:3-hydroxybutyryl-CoA dehydrogenase